MNLQTPEGLIEYAFFLRQYGERAPGGNETWREWHTAAEIWLRSHDHTFAGPKDGLGRCSKCEVKAGDHIG